ncbi:hypothetical protein NQ318_014514, partial [Aromia moschata]
KKVEQVTGEIKAAPHFLSPTAQPSAITDTRSVSFDDIPGPRTLRLISKFWGTIPVVGTELTVSIIQYLLSGGKFFGGILSWGGNRNFFKRFFDTYGPVVRLHGPFGSDVVLLSRPEHASAVFQNEGPYPVRSCLDSVEKYRSEYREVPTTGAISYIRLNSFRLRYGPEWEKLRKVIEQPLQAAVTQQFDRIDKISDEFVQRICTIRNKQEEMPNSFKNEIFKWCLECMCSVTLNRKLGFLDACGLSSTSDPGRLLEGLNGATEAIRKCEYGPHLWKFIETPAWKSLVKHCDSVDGVINKYVERAVSSLREKKDKSAKFENMSLLEILLLRENFVPDDALTVLLDMFLIGVNATAHTVAFLFYHLARNPRCQMKLYEEIKALGENINKDSLKNLKYLAVCVKETLRLDPPIPILSRRLNSDVVIHHYVIPKGTHILPERWLNNELGGFGNEFQAFASLPFGHGPKACLAKEMVEMQLGLLLVKVIKQFRIEYNYGDIRSSDELLSSPTKPLKFRFINRG